MAWLILITSYVAEDLVTLFHRLRNFVKHCLLKRCWCATDTIGCSVLPENKGLPVSLEISCVQPHQCIFAMVEFISNFSSSNIDKLVLRGVPPIFKPVQAG